MTFFIGFCVVSLAIRWQPSLWPSEILIAAVLVCMFALLLATRVAATAVRHLLLLFAGGLLAMSYGHWMADRALDSRIPITPVKHDAIAKIRVDSLVANKGRHWQFTGKIVHADGSAPNVLAGKSLLLNFYPKRRASGSEPPITPCATIQADIRVKAPRGLVNGAGFDYEAYLLQKRIDGRGYVREVLAVQPATGLCINALRQRFASYVMERFPANGGWILALTIGERAWLDAEQRRLLTQTGTAHLFVISGLHIGLAAGVFYGLMSVFFRYRPRAEQTGYDWRLYAGLASWLFAAFYGGLAGFSIPVQRALIGLAVFLISSQLALNWGLWLRYWLAMFAVLVFDPLAPLNSGFILSFAAVFVLLLVAGLQQRAQPPSSHKWRSKLGLFVKLQGVLFVGLMPFSILWFQGFSLVSPIVNLVAIPLLGSVIVPLCLLGFIVWMIAGTDMGLLGLAAHILNTFFSGLEAVANNPYLPAFFTEPLQPLLVGLLLFSIVLLVLPPLVNQRILALPVLVLTLIVGRQGGFTVDEKPTSITVLDVGQGLSILVESGNRSLLYDTGAAWATGSMAQMVVLPVMYQRGIRQLDYLVISHLDNDHAGGASDVLGAVSVAKVLTSNVVELNKQVNSAEHTVESCHHYPAVTWPKLTLRFLSADNSDLTGNDGSCVLMIEAVDGKRLLIPGDIERDGERALIKRSLSDQLRSDWLIVPHHGSKTSSSVSFLAAAEPALAITTTGFANRYRHPHPDVIDRYHERGIDVLDTAQSGAVVIDQDDEGQWQISTLRHQQKRFWR